MQMNYNVKTNTFLWCPMINLFIYTFTDRKMWVVLVYKTVDPLTRMYVSISTDLHAKYRNVVEFLRSPTAQRLGTPIAGSYFYVSLPSEPQQNTN